MGLFDTELPIDEALPRLTAALRQNHSAVLVAPPGAGKTTRVPLCLIDTLWAADKKILVLEPRRLAARAVTERLTGCEVERAYVDKGYRGHSTANPRRVFISGQKRGVFGVIKRELRRRSASKPSSAT